MHLLCFFLDAFTPATVHRGQLSIPGVKSSKCHNLAETTWLSSHSGISANTLTCQLFPSVLNMLAWMEIPLFLSLLQHLHRLRLTFMSTNTGNMASKRCLLPYFLLSCLSPVLEITYCSVKCVFLAVCFICRWDTTGRHILLTGLFMVTGILSRRVSKACVNSLTRIRP